MRRLAIVFLSFLLVAGAFSSFKIFAKDSEEFADDALVVRFEEGTSEQEKEEILSSIQARREKRINRINAERVRIRKSKVRENAEKLRKNVRVKYAEPDFVAKKTEIPNDTYYSSQWGLPKIKAGGAWDMTHGSDNAPVAIVDTGIDEAHPDLSGKVVKRANFTWDPDVDGDGHGTHVAGIVAATTNNSLGVASLGYDSKLFSVKVLDNTGSGYYSWITNAIIWAADNGANVINMSLGGSAPSQTLQAAVDYAWSKGVVVVAAAGNDGNSAASYPGYYTNVIAVAATDINDSKASWSNYGSWVDVAAPGVSIYSTYKGGYAYLSGTSMATPFTAGLASLIYAKGECSTNTCVRNKIESSADHIMGTGNYFTHGRINAYNAVSSSSYNEATPTPTLTTAPTPIESGPTPTPTATPTPTQIPANTMTVSEITMWYTVARNYRYVYTKVRVVSSTNSPVKGATVKLTLKDPSGNNFTYSKNTNINGEITINRRSNLKGTFTSTVTNIIKSGITYNPTNITQTLLVQ